MSGASDPRSLDLLDSLEHFLYAQQGEDAAGLTPVPEMRQANAASGAATRL